METSTNNQRSPERQITTTAGRQDGRKEREGEKHQPKEPPAEDGSAAIHVQ